MIDIHKSDDNLLAQRMNVVRHIKQHMAIYILILVCIP